MLFGAIVMSMLLMMMCRLGRQKSEVQFGDVADDDEDAEDEFDEDHVDSAVVVVDDGAERVVELWRSSLMRMKYNFTKSRSMTSSRSLYKST